MRPADCDHLHLRVARADDRMVCSGCGWVYPRETPGVFGWTPREGLWDHSPGNRSYASVAGKSARAARRGR